MSKLTKKQKRELKRQKMMGNFVPFEEENKKPLFSKLSFFSIIEQNYFILLGIVSLVLLVYFNSFDNQLTLVDDLQAITFNEKIKDLNGNLKSLMIQPIFHSLMYKYFGYDPLPLRIGSVTLHVMVTIMVFLITYIIFDKKKAAAVTAVLFAVHSANTEAVTWISGMPYLLTAFFGMLIVILFLQYKRFNSKKFLYAGFAVYLLMMITLRSPWVLIIPFALVVLDQFFLEKEIKWNNLWWLLLFVLPIFVYMTTYFGPAFKERMEYRSGSGGDRVTLHSQALTPVIEGYPYTTYTMSKLYLFPKDLTVYYDGTPVTTALYVSMYIWFFIYVFLVFYFWKRNRRVTGILIMLPLLLAPSYSPIKVTWFLAERYMYMGTAFFSMLIFIIMEYLEKKTHRQYLIYGFFSFLVIALSIRTFIRNDDWQDTVTLSLANMKTSPYSVRPYNDIAGHYYYLGDIKKAVEYYEKGLEVLPNSGTSISNLGFLYFERGPLLFWDDYDLPNPDKDKAKLYFGQASNLSPESRDARIINYFLNKALTYDPASTEIASIMGDLYLKMGYAEEAKKLYELALSSDPSNEQAQQQLELIP